MAEGSGLEVPIPTCADEKIVNRKKISESESLHFLIILLLGVYFEDANIRIFQQNIKKIKNSIINTLNSDKNNS